MTDDEKLLSAIRDGEETALQIAENIVDGVPCAASPEAWALWRKMTYSRIRKIAEMSMGYCYTCVTRDAQDWHADQERGSR